MAHFVTRVFARLLRDAIFDSKPGRKRHHRAASKSLSAADIQTIANKIATTKAKPVIGLRTLPAWPKACTMIVPDGSRRYTIDLSSYSCTCMDWMTNRSALPATDLRRFCAHVSEAVWTKRSALVGWPLWSKAVAQGLQDWPFPMKSEDALFSNGMEDFLCVYDSSRGYVQVFNSAGAPHFGLSMGSDAHRDRWAHEYRPPCCVALKKAMRPWVVAMHAKHANG